MLASTYEGVIHDQPEQGSLFPAERVLPSRTRDGKSGESAGRARPRWRKEAQEDRTYFEQRSPQADRRCATTTLGKSAESCCQASQVVTAVIVASTADGLVRNFSQGFASGAGAGLLPECPSTSSLSSRRALSLYLLVKLLRRLGIFLRSICRTRGRSRLS